MTGRARLVALSGFAQEHGKAFICPLPASLRVGDTLANGASSRLELFEDGNALGPAHSLHVDIRGRGRGRFSHWNDMLIMSTSDDTDPSVNGRQYVAYEPAASASPQLGEAIAVLEALPATYERTKAFNALERCFALLDPAAKLGEDAKLFWQDEPFLRAFETFTNGNYRSLERKYAVHQLVSSLDHVAGDLAECGVYNGATSYFMKLAAPGRTLHLFDSFEGISVPEKVDGTHWKAGVLACPQDVVERNLSRFDNLRFYKGWIPDRFDEVGQQTFSFVHVDVDLFAPTAASIAFFYSRLQPGGMLVCDDYGFTTCPGATKAFDDFMRDKPERIIHLPTAQGLMIKQ